MREFRVVLPLLQSALEQLALSFRALQFGHIEKAQQDRGLPIRTEKVQFILREFVVNLMLVFRNKIPIFPIVVSIQRVPVA